MAQGRNDTHDRGRTGAAQRLRETIGAAAFDRYFCEAGVASGGSAPACLDTDNGRLRVRVANPFAGSLIEQRFSAALEAAARAEGLAPAVIEVDPAASWRRRGDTPDREPAGEPNRDTPNGTSAKAPAQNAPTAPGRPGDSRHVSTRPSHDLDRAAPRLAAGATRRPGSVRTNQNAGTASGGFPGNGPADRRLEDFVVGPSNRAAYEAACRMGDAQDDPGFGPLVIYGACGVGKSHLLRGVATRFRETSGDRSRTQVRSTTAEAFMSAYVEAVKASRVPAFQRQFRRVALLCIDDVHFLANKGGTQRELLHTFDALDLTGARVVLVTDEHPRDIAKLSQPLVSRFVGGVVVRIDAPDDDLAERIVERMATQRNLVLADGAARAVVTWVRTAARSRSGEAAEASARDLAGAVARLKATCSVSPHLLGPAGTVGAVMVDAALSPAGASGDGGPRASARAGYRHGRAAIREIIDASATTLGVTVGEVLGRGRHKRVVLARSVASYLCREMTNHSTPEIAVKLGRPNHSTVVTASQRVTNMIKAGERVAVGGASDGLLVEDLVGEVRRRVSAGR